MTEDSGPNMLSKCHCWQALNGPWHCSSTGEGKSFRQGSRKRRVWHSVMSGSKQAKSRASQVLLIQSSTVCCESQRWLLRAVWTEEEVNHCGTPEDQLFPYHTLLVYVIRHEMLHNEILQSCFYPFFPLGSSWVRIAWFELLHQLHMSMPLLSWSTFKALEAFQIVHTLSQ